MTVELTISTQTRARTVNRPTVRFEVPFPQQPSLSPRAQLLAAFRAIGTGVDEKSAGARTTRWYRSSNCEWTRGLT